MRDYYLSDSGIIHEKLNSFPELQRKELTNLIDLVQVLSESSESSEDSKDLQEGIVDSLNTLYSLVNKA